MTVYEEIFEVIKARKAQYDAGNAPEKSYTCYLFDKGVNDLLYHVMVLCADRGLEWSEVEEVLNERNEKIGNLKQFHTTDKLS